VVSGPRKRIFWIEFLVIDLILFPIVPIEKLMGTELVI
jgi:nitrate reductase NapE component